MRCDFHRPVYLEERGLMERAQQICQMAALGAGSDIRSSQLHRYDDVIYLLTAIGLTPDGSGTVHIYTQTIPTKWNRIPKTELHNN